MRSNRMLPILAVVGGAVGAALRAVQLRTAFEPGTGLYISGNLWGRLLIFWLLLMAASFAFSARQGQHDGSFEELFAGSGDLYKTVLAFCGLLLAAGGVAWLAAEMSVMKELQETAGPWVMALEIPFGLLCIAAGLCMVTLGAVLARGTVSQKQALLTLPMLFWSAFHLLVAYRQYCVSANLALFTLEIFASIACVLSFYYFARMLYGKPAPRRFAFCASNAICLSIADTVGYAFGRMFGTSAMHWTAGSVVRGCCLLLGCVFLLTELSLMTSRVFRPGHQKRVAAAAKAKAEAAEAEIDIESTLDFELPPDLDLPPDIEWLEDIISLSNLEWPI